MVPEHFLGEWVTPGPVTGPVPNNYSGGNPLDQDMGYLPPRTGGIPHPPGQEYPLVRKGGIPSPPPLGSGQET